MGYPDLPVFLGVGRYKGTWNASTNSGTLATAPVGGYEAHDTTPLFSSGSTHIRNPNALGGYDGGTNLTATLGDFWKVITAGSTPIDGEDTWRVSDFVVFTYNSGSTSGSTWQKLNYTDTISSIMYGNGSGGSTVFGLSAADVHEFTGSLYVSGALFAEELNTTSHNHTVITSIIEKSGSTTFGDSADDKHAFNGTLTVAGDISGSGKILNVGGIETAGALNVSGSTILGSANNDTHTFKGLVVADDPVSLVDNLTVSGTITVKGGGVTNLPLRFTSSAGNTDFQVFQYNRQLGILNQNAGDFALGILDRKVSIGDQSPSHTLTVYGDMSGSGKLFNLGGIETAENLNVSGSTILGSANNDTHTFNGSVTSNDPVVMMDNMDVSGTVILHGQTLRLTSSAQNTDIYVAQAGRGLWIYNRSGDNGLDYNLVMYDSKVQVGAASVPTHTLTVAGDMSGSGMLTAVAGVTTAGDANISGSAGVRGNVVCLGTVYTIDMSGSGKILNVGGIETAGDLGVTGSANISGSVRIFGTVGGSLEMSGTATNSHFKLLHQMKGLSLYDASHENYIWRAQNERLQIGSNNVPSHTLTVAGDLSGSGKILNVGGIETQGNLGVTGSLTVRGTSVINGNSRFASSAQIGYAAAASVTHPLMVSGDISGSGKIFNLGGIETAADLGVTGSVTAGNVMPRTDNTFDLGSSSKRWANIYTGDLHLKNDRGDWTIVEEEDYLSVINNKTSKKYKMVLEEIED